MAEGTELLNGRERTGIVEEGELRRITYGRYIVNRVSAHLARADVQMAINKKIDERIQAEVDAIIGRRLEEKKMELEQANPPLNRPDLRSIIETVCAVTEQNRGEMQSPNRARRIAWPRHFAFYVVKRVRRDLSLPQIGRAFGNRDHTTVLHGLRKVKESLKAAERGEIDGKPFAGWLADERIKALLP